jgi:hypothetical protein
LVKLTASRFSAIFVLLLSWIVGLTVEGTVGTIIMFYGAKAALILWFLPQLKAVLKTLKEWRFKSGLKTWNEAKREEKS